MSPERRALPSVKQGSVTSIAQLTQPDALGTLPDMQSILERVLAEMPEWKRKRFLAWAVEHAREQGDLGLLRVVRAYQKAHGIPYHSRAMN
jgi:hypothetical protein